MAKVISPIKDFNDTTVVGRHTLAFKDSVAEITQPLNEGELAYFQMAGYKVQGEQEAEMAAPVRRVKRKD